MGVPDCIDTSLKETAVPDKKFVFSLCLLSLVITNFNYFGYVFKHQSNNNVFQFQKCYITLKKTETFDDFFTSVVAALKTVFNDLTLQKNTFLPLKKQALNIHCRSLGKSHF